MADTTRRFSVSMAAGLVRQLDTLVEAKGYANRSQAIADMVRDRLVVQLGAAGHQEIAGTVTLVYDHHRPNLQAVLTEAQHDEHDLILATMHVHLDHHNCLEVIALRGPADRVRRMADRLLAVRGVKHGKLTVTTTGTDFEP